MASRLPKPKVTMKKAASEMAVNRGFLKATNAGNADAAPTAAIGSKPISKSKSSLDITTKASNENKLLTSKPVLLRTKTSATIARSGDPKPVKRPGTTSDAVEPKKPKLRTTEKASVTNRPAPRVAATSRATNVVAKGATSVVAKDATKSDRSNVQDRLKQANDELLAIKESHKHFAHLADVVEALKTKEMTTMTRIEELEVSLATLTDELTSTKRNYEDTLEKYESLRTELKESKESYEKLSNTLKKAEDTCASQKLTLAEYAATIEDLEKNLNCERRMNVDLTDKVKDLETILHRMDQDRRVLHNVIQEMKGNIRVFCRVRPKIPKESSKALCMINFVDECTIEIGRLDAVGSKARAAKQEFSFDKVFPPTASQAEVFEELSLLVQSALEGYNVCVFAYGQTGSGKTYTMEGRPDNDGEGMIPRTVRHIFNEMKQFELLGWEYRIEASFIEIYNEHIVDLLDSQQKNHEIRMADSKGHDLYVTNLRVEAVNSPEELHNCLRIAQKNRAVAATFSNERSSRSHSIARIRLIGTHAEKEQRSVGNLNLVDLAGSEKFRGEEAARTAETKNINKSLANLGNVILALLKKQDHIPYRNSKLTHLLMPSLGGNSKTLMLLNISPLDECYSETLNSLRFASVVNSCKTGNVKRTRQSLHI